MRISERFWSKVEIRESNECWLWFGGLKGEYGGFWTGSKVEYAHRVAFGLDEAMIPHLKIMQTCGNPRCVNPNHLVLATKEESKKWYIHRMAISTGHMKV